MNPWEQLAVQNNTNYFLTYYCIASPLGSESTCLYLVYNISYVLLENTSLWMQHIPCSVNPSCLTCSCIPGQDTLYKVLRRQWHPTPVLLPGKSHGRRSLAGFSPWGREELDTTERLHFHLSLSCIGEGNGNPLQCSCLENPRDGGAWWAAVYGVTQSQTRLKRLSSSSSSRQHYMGWMSGWATDGRL